MNKLFIGTRTTYVYQYKISMQMYDNSVWDKLFVKPAKNNVVETRSCLVNEIITNCSNLPDGNNSPDTQYFFDDGRLSIGNILHYLIHSEGYTKLKRYALNVPSMRIVVERTSTSEENYIDIDGNLSPYVEFKYNAYVAFDNEDDLMMYKLVVC